MTISLALSKIGIIPVTTAAANNGSIGGGDGSGGRGSICCLQALVFATTANGHITKSPSISPVPLTSFAKMARLRLVVIVVVIKLCIRGTTPWTLQRL